MFDLPGVLGTLANLAVIILGFGAIIFLHELGHFLAAKWAGIRVLAFSMGMGPVVASYRRGVGWRRGSSEPEYRRLAYADTPGAGGTPESPRVSPTEYRLSALPIGGYVKMLGQEDANPGAVSDAPDSYQNRPVWKRMVVICAGVVMNLITAAVLFVVVFTVGLRVQPPVVGHVEPGAPAETATAVNRGDVPPGLLPEDRIVSVGGHTVRAFNEVSVEVAMGARGEPVRLVVERPGVPGPIEFEARPEVHPLSGFLDLGVGPALSNRLLSAENMPGWEQATRRIGLPGVEPGSVLLSVNGVEARRPDAIGDAVRASGGEPVAAEFSDGDGRTRSVQIRPVRELQEDAAQADGPPAPHLLGLTPLLRVDPDSAPEDTRQGLVPGDVLVRIGETEFPSYLEALTAIRAARGQDLTLEVERAAAAGGTERVTLGVKVNGKGQVGFLPVSTADTDSRVGRPMRVHRASEDGDGPGVSADTPAFGLIDRPGTRIVSVAGEPVASLRDVPGAIERALRAPFEAGGAGPFSVMVALEPPLPVQPDGSRPTLTREWTLTRADVETVLGLGWSLEMGDAYQALFEAEEVVDKAEGPLAAVGRGLGKSRQVMNQTYLTFLRLFQGTVKVQHLKGPVGIAHLGTQVADQGFIWVLFFLGLVSVNLAVINFLPLPIVDGGQFLMLAYEGLRGRPMPVVVQNVVTLAGLVLIVSVFLVVTFHDVRAIFGV